MLEANWLTEFSGLPATEEQTLIIVFIDVFLFLRNQNQISIHP